MAERTNISDKDRQLREARYRCAVPNCGTTPAIGLHHMHVVRNGGGDHIYITRPSTEVAP